MKPSSFNHFFPYDDIHHVAYNSFTNNLATIENHNLALFRRFCETGEGLPDELKDDLAKGGFVIEDHVDELVMLILFSFSIPCHLRAKRSKTSVFEQPSLPRFSKCEEY